MLQCPNCQVEIKPGERFCGNCGARQPDPPAANPPRIPSGKETVVLSPVGEPPAADNDRTILAGPAPVPPSQFPPAAGAPQALPTTPVTPPPPVGGYPGASMPGSVAPPPKSGSNIWKILGIIVAIGVVACTAIGGGVYYFVVRPAVATANNALATAQAGGTDLLATASAGGDLLSTAAAGGELASTALAGGVATLEALPTPEILATLEAEATSEPVSGDAGGAVLLRDTFDNPTRSNFDDGESDNASYAFNDGTYTVTAKQPQLIVWQTARGDYGNASIAVDATIDGAEGNAAALIFHYQDNKNFYIYTITGDGRYSLDVYKDDELTTLIDWTEAAAINRTGELNALRVETVDDTIRLYANDELLEEITDATFTRGKAAIGINTFDEQDLTVTFDNLVIKSIK